jgi:nitrite reductase/ring-hydroxylating ferredoxin subunit
LSEIYVGHESEFEEGGRKVISDNGLVIGVFRVNGRFFAYENECAHMGGPVCQGGIFQRVEQNLAPDRTIIGYQFSEDHCHIVCPWHGYEYDLESGAFPANPKMRLRKFEVELRDGEVYVVV